MYSLKNIVTANVNDADRATQKVDLEIREGAAKDLLTNNIANKIANSLGAEERKLAAKVFAFKEREKVEAVVDSFNEMEKQVIKEW